MFPVLQLRLHDEMCDLVEGLLERMRQVMPDASRNDLVRALILSGLESATPGKLVRHLANPMVTMRPGPRVA